MSERVIFHTGTGTASTTAVAAATALRVAAGGRRVLLLSTGPAHGLGDLLGVALGPEPRAVGDGLWALEASARAELERRWPAAPAWLGASALPPGGAELGAALVLAGQALADDWEVVVVDGGPAGEALRLLVLPETARAWLARVAPAHRRLAAAVLPWAGAAGSPEALGELARTARVLMAFDDVLQDPERSSVRLVVAPGALAAGRRTAGLLELHGLGPDAVVAGRGPGDAASVLAPVPVLELGSLDAGDPAALELVAAALWPGEDAAAVRHVHPAPDLAVGRDGATLRLALPHADRAQLALHHVGGALVLALGEHRRSLALPPAVADYRPAGARFREGVLHVDLAPPTAP